MNYEAEPSDLFAEQKAAAYTYSVSRRFGQRILGIFQAVTPGLIGLDCSHWQSFIDFSIAKTKGVLWAYIRALHGLTVDTKFFLHYPAAEGIVPRAAYLYYREDQDPILQARKLLETCLVNGDIGDFQPVLDVESINNPVLLASDIKLCCEELTQLFLKKPLIYTGFYVWRDAVYGEKAWAVAYSLLIAAYPFLGWTDDLPQRVLSYPPLIPAPWQMWTDNPDEDMLGRVVGWQFTSVAPASEYGVSGNYLDLNWCSPAFQKQVLNAQPLPPDPAPIGEPQMQFINTGTGNSNIRTAALVSIPNLANVIGALPANATVTALEMKIGAGYVWIKYAIKPEWLLPGKTDAVGWSALVAISGSPLIDFYTAVPCP